MSDFCGDAKEETVVADVVEYFRDYYVKFDDEALSELFEFECRHFRSFDVADEFSLEHDRLHRQYRALFERVCEAHLRARGVSTTAFVDALKRDADGDHPRRRRHAAAFLAIVDKADSFRRFAESMRAAAQQARWLEEPD